MILFEDAHLLVVNKPSGINTHKPDPFTPDGLHEWLMKRHGPLSVLQRLDKDTSGVILFGKTREANQSLSRQFEAHQIRKVYLLLSATKPTRQKFHAHTKDATTEFEFMQAHGRNFLVEARPVTGKTHQIRRQAAEIGFPILGDTKYEGAPAPRLMLHAYSLTFTHPVTGEKMTMYASVPAVFDEIDPLVAAVEFRQLAIEEDTNAYRLISGAADGFPDVIADSYAGRLLVQWQTERAQPALYDELQKRCQPLAIYEQVVTKQRRTPPALIAGTAAPERFPILENGVRYLINFGEGFSTGIFLDQRENRRRLLTMKLAGKSVLNCFAYTCGFSVAAAQAGAVTTSIDLSRNYLEWGKANFAANELATEKHQFLTGDVFEWLKRMGKRGEKFDVVILDPPTFSTTKQGRAFQAERDYGALAALAVPVVAKGGWLLCSTNQRTLAPDKMGSVLRQAVLEAGRLMGATEFETAPVEFRVAEREKPYLKTFWLRLD